MTHKYDNIVENFKNIFDEMSRLKLLDVLAKGGVGEIILAHHLKQELVVNDKGADGLDKRGNKFEYKVSITDQFNFHFGTRLCKSGESPCEKVRKHFTDVSGTFCALRSGATIKKLIFIPASDIVTDLCDHFSKTNGQQLNKNYNFAKLTSVPNSVVYKV